MLLIGGVNSESMLPLSSVESFNVEKGTWSTKVKPMPKMLTGHAGIVLEQEDDY